MAAVNYISDIKIIFGFFRQFLHYIEASEQQRFPVFFIVKQFCVLKHIKSKPVIALKRSDVFQAIEICPVRVPRGFRYAFVAFP
jgi:hypothetical protein